MTDDNKCVLPPTVSNISALSSYNNYIETQPNATLAALKKQIQDYKTSGTPYLECSQSQPYFNLDTYACTNVCSDGTFLDLATSRCIICMGYIQLNHTCIPALVSNIPVIISSNAYL